MKTETLHIYVRVSTKNQAEFNTSLEQQQSAGIALSKSLGMDYVIWNEGAASSSTEEIHHRPVLTEMIGEIEDGNINHLYAEYTDRLSRNQKTWGTIRFLLQRSGVKLYTGSDSKPIDLSDPMDELLLSILSAISTYDNQIRTIRLNKGKFKRIERNGWQGGPPPFGYKIEDGKLELDEYESIWVRKIFETFRDTKSIMEVRSLLSKNGVKTRRGNILWSLGSIEKLLKNTHFHGHYTVNKYSKVWDPDTKKYQKEIVQTFQVECPPIIDPVLGTEVSNLLDQRSNQTRLKESRQKYTYLLQDFLHCGSCGCKMTGKTQKNKNYEYASYYCPSKTRNWSATSNFRDCNNQRQIRKEELDQIIWDEIVSVVENSHNFKETVKKESLSQNRTFNRSEKDIKKDERRLRSIDKGIDQLKETLSSLSISKVLKESADIDYDKTIAATNKKIVELQSERIKLLKGIEDSKVDQKWIDWIEEFQTRVKNLRTEKDENEKKKFLEGILTSIDVYTENDGKDTSHRFEVTFKVPVVNDEFIWIDRNDKSKGSQILDGSNVLIITSKDKKKG